MFNFVKKAEAQIILLQETHSIKQKAKVWTTEWGGQGFYSHGESNSKGVATFIKRNLNCRVCLESSDDNGRILILDLELDDNIYTIANIYAPNHDDPGFFI